MHRARFVNPFDTRYDGAAVTVTRGDVFSPPPDVPSAEETADDLRRLDTLVRAQVDVDLEHSPRPSKRRKLSGGAVDSIVPFRLLALSDAREISLVPKEHPARKRDFPVEDTSQERKTRRARAQQTAIDRPSASPSLPSANPSQPRVLRLLTVPSEISNLPPFFTASVSKSTPSAPRNPNLDWTRATERASKPVSCCPSLSLEDMGAEPKPRRRRRQRDTLAERAPAAFWRPPPDLGGKSAGYALGWPASVPGAVGYVRCSKHTLSAF